MASTADTSIRLRSAAKASGRSPHFRALVELATDGVVIVNESGQVRYANAAFRQWIGEPAGTEETTDLLERVVAGDRGALAKALEAVGGGGGLALRLPSFRIHARDGTVRELEGTGTALPARNGTGNHVLHLRDVTEQRLADLRLRRSEESARIINDFATSLLELKVEEDVLWDVVRNCVGKLGLPDCVVYVVDRPRSVLVQRAAWGPKAPVGRAIVNPLEIPLGQGIVGAVGQSGKPELVSDTRADPRYIVDDAPRLSELAVPILVDGDVVGVIDAEHPDEGFFREHHLEILTAIASLLANQLTRVWAEQALRRLNADLERRVHERTSELEAANARLQREVSERARAQRIQQALYQISEAMHQSGDLQALYRRLHEIIGTLMPARNFYLALCDADDGTVTFPYHVDELDPPPPPRRGYRGMTEYVLRTGRACLADLGEIARLKESDEYQQTVAPARIWLGVPLAVRGQTFGVMAVQDHHDPRAFGAEEKQILSFVADQTALAIDRKRAGQDLQRALDQERELVRLKGNFVNLVSHEFRTPIGVILGSAQVLESYFRPTRPRASRGASRRHRGRGAAHGRTDRRGAVAGPHRGGPASLPTAAAQRRRLPAAAGRRGDASDGRTEPDRGRQRGRPPAGAFGRNPAAARFLQPADQRGEILAARKSGLAHGRGDWHRGGGHRPGPRDRHPGRGPTPVVRGLLSRRQRRRTSRHRARPRHRQALRRGPRRRGAPQQPGGPRHHRHRPPSALPLPGAARSQPMKHILIVEDHAPMRRSLETTLEMEGFAVHSAEDGRRGIDLALSELPDLIVCDVQMPQIDGHAVLRALRADPRTQFIPFVFLTAWGERQDIRAGMSAGADDYLVKPVDRQELLDAVRIRLAREELRRRNTVGFRPDFASPKPLEELGLSAREAEVLLWMAQGKSDADIGSVLGISGGTVKKHAAHIFQKLGVENRHAAAVRALEELCRVPPSRSNAS